MIVRLKIVFFILLIGCKATGQQVSFSNINTTTGLSDNFIRSVAVDKKGFLWIGTNEGLNSYDGYSVTNYSIDEYPAIPGKTIVHLLCDSKDNIWMGSVHGAAWADTKRNFHRVVLNDTLKEYNCSYIIETKKFGPVLFTDKGQFYQDKEKKSWQQLRDIPASLDFDELVEVINFNEDSLLVATINNVMLVDYTTRKIVYEYPLKNIISLCRIDGNRVALADWSGHVFIIDITTGNILHQFDMTVFDGRAVDKNSWAELRMAVGGNLLYASNRLGFFIINKDLDIKRYKHEPADPHSIAGDKVVRVLGTANGNVIIGTERYGLSIFNIMKKQASYQKFFRDEKGNYFDGYLTKMVQDKDGTFWIGAVDRLIHWNRKTNLSTFYYYDQYNAEFGVKNSEIHRICIDKRGQIWVSVLGCGPALFDRNTGQFKLLTRDTASFPLLKSNFVYDLFEDSRGKIWAACGTGFYLIDPVTHKIEIPTDTLLKKFNGSRTHHFAEDSKKRIWFSTWDNGVICYDPVQKTIKQFTKKDGLLNDVAGDLMMGSHDDLYITMMNGFNIIRSNGSIESYGRKEGLRFDKADAFLEDNEGYIWISNAKCLVKFDPSTKKMEIFDEHENLNNGGFKPVSSLKTPNGELLWGTQSGLNYFYPNQFINTPEAITVSIYQVMAGDSVYATDNDRTQRIRFGNNDLQFYFTAINLRGSHSIRYQYKLEGYDTKWQEGTDIRQARYSSLPPGDYSFKLRASAGMNGWIESGNSFSFEIITPVYMRWWFKAAIALLIIGALYYFFRRRNKQLQQKKEELETEQAINYFASSIYEHQTTEDILWDVARNCIGRLHFEDCVIYLIDEDKKVLVQKAAHGPKSPRSFEITKPIDIPVGKGIVGTVAATGKAELINDTTKDSRYIVDDEVRYSEISVPIVSNGKVLGVIDCEHSKKRFFTQKHLSILTTIASLCANKVVRAKAEAEKKYTEIMLAETKQKMAEAEMQALRAQMNPHFIFNCLNSINRYIVKSDQATASLYLTRFAKLIRLILDNSHSKNVILSNEIEALRLYIEMESLRFDNKFKYEIQVESGVHADSIEIPPLIIQPYVENAIWHGLLHKESEGRLHITIRLLSPGMLQCIIRDNGVGREKSSELKSKSVTKKKSLGMELTESRLLLLNQYASVHSSVEIQDLKNENGEATGTQVILKIPIGDN